MKLCILFAAAALAASGGDLQFMIYAAAPGDTIRLEPGTYRQKVLIPREKKGLRLLGGGKAVVTWDDYAGKKCADGTDLGTFSNDSRQASLYFLAWHLLLEFVLHVV